MSLFYAMVGGKKRWRKRKGEREGGVGIREGGGVGLGRDTFID